MSMDLLGTLLFIPAVLTLLLGLEYGGSEYPWANWRVIVLFVLSPLLLAIFAWVQIRAKERALIPPKIICNRDMLAVICFSMFSQGALFIFTYYVSLALLSQIILFFFFFDPSTLVATSLVPSRQGDYSNCIWPYDITHGNRASHLIICHGGHSFYNGILHAIHDHIIRAVVHWSRHVEHHDSYLRAGALYRIPGITECWPRARN